MNDFKVFLKSLTISPGVYQFYNNKKEIIILVKQKILKKEFHHILIKTTPIIKPEF